MKTPSPEPAHTYRNQSTGWHLSPAELVAQDVDPEPAVPFSFGEPIDLDWFDSAVTQPDATKELK